MPHQAVPMLLYVYQRKVVNYGLFSIYENRMITWLRTWLSSLTKISFAMIWPGLHIDQNSIYPKHMNKYPLYQSTSTRQLLQQSLALSGAKWYRWVIVMCPLVGMYQSIPYDGFIFLWLFIEFPLCCVGRMTFSMCFSFDVYVLVRNSSLHNKNFAFSPQQVMGPGLHL